MSYLILFCIYILGPLLIAAVYIYLSRAYTHWSSKPLIYETSRPVRFGVGHFGPVFYSKKSLPTLCLELYSETPSYVSLLGFYFFRKPAVLICEPQLVRQVLETKWESFSYPFVLPSEKTDPLLAEVPPFGMHAMWMKMVFKFDYNMNASFNTMIGICLSVKGYLTAILDQTPETPIELNFIIDRFIRRIMMNVGLGIELDSNDASKAASDIATSVRNALEPGYHQSLCLLIPKLASFLGIRLVPKDTHEKLRNLVKKLKYGIYPSFPDCMLHWLSFIHPDQNELVLQLFAFFMEVQVYLSTLGCFALYELAKQPWIQYAAKQEVRRVLGLRLEWWTLTNLNSLECLDRIIKETIRLYTPIGCISRVCTQRVRLEHMGQGCWVRPGDLVFISSQGLHLDPRYWSDPKAFNPDRFEQKPTATYLPYEGTSIQHLPFCKMALKMFLATMLMAGEIKEMDDGIVPIMQIDETSYMTRPKGEIKVKISKTRRLF